MSWIIQQHDLIEYCRKFINDNLSCDALTKVHNFAQENQICDLVIDVKSYIYTNFKSISQNEATMRFSGDLVNDIVRSDEIRVVGEEQVLRWVCNWFNFDFQSRKSLMKGLLDEIRFSCITSPASMRSAIDGNVDLEIYKHCCNYLKMSHNHPSKPRRYYEGVYMYRSMIYHDDDGNEVELPEEILFQRYCPKTNSLTSLGLPSQSRDFTQMSVVNDLVYIHGGFIAHNNRADPHKYLKSMEVYHPIHEVWSVVEPMNHARSDHVSCTFEGKILVFGGVNSSNWVENWPSRFTKHPSLTTEIPSEVYDPVENTWEILPNQPKLGICWGAAAIGDSIFLICKTRTHRPYRLRQYKPNTNKWFDIAYHKSLDLYNGTPIYAVRTKLFIFQSPGKVTVYDTINKSFHQNYFGPRGDYAEFHEFPGGLVFAFHEEIYHLRNKLGDPTKDMVLVVLDPKVLDDCRSVTHRIRTLFKRESQFEDPISVGEAFISTIW